MPDSSFWKYYLSYFHLSNKERPTIPEDGDRDANPPMLLSDMTDETVDEKFQEMMEENQYREVVLR